MGDYMRLHRYAGCALAMGGALMLSAVASADAQTDTTRRAVSERRIPVQKDQNFSSQPSRRISTGEVMLSEDRARIDALEAAVTTYTMRLDSIAAATATIGSRSEATALMVTALQDSLRNVRGELTNVRGELTTVTARNVALGEEVAQLNQRFTRLQHGSLFGNSGFYVGLGTGANLTTGSMNDIGFKHGLNITMPIGFQKRGTFLGVRGELGLQTFDGRATGGFENLDPRVYSAVGMLTANFPLNEGKTHQFYLMGGGGAYMFRDLGASSALNGPLGASTSTSSSSNNATKWGVTGGAGFEFHVLGAANIFVQTRLTNIFADDVATAGTTSSSGSLRWIPIVAGFTLR